MALNGMGVRIKRNLMKAFESMAVDAAKTAQGASGQALQAVTKIAQERSNMVAQAARGQQLENSLGSEVAMVVISVIQIEEQ
jgi:hypothetical protein